MKIKEKYKSADNIKEATKVLKEGGIIIFPTDTAFGIGCRIDRPDSIKRLFRIRKRPPHKATPVLVDSLDMAQKYWYSPLPDIVRHLTAKYWPGGLTIVYKCIVDKVPSLVRGGRSSLGLRMPDHEITLKLIKDVGVPILGPSANFHSETTPYEFKDISKELIHLVDYVLEGVCKVKQVSTVIDCTKKPMKVLRLGTIEVGNETLAI